jgi:hypothetical protein
MKTQNKRTIGDVVKDAGKGLALVGVGAGLAYLGVEYVDWLHDILREQGQAGGSPPPIDVYTVLHLPAIGAGLGALGTAFLGVSKMFGYDPLKLNEEEPTYQNEG